MMQPRHSLVLPIVNINAPQKGAIDISKSCLDCIKCTLAHVSKNVKRRQAIYRF